MTANYTAVKLEAGRLTVQRTIIAAGGWVLPNFYGHGVMHAWVIFKKFKILMSPVAGTWF